MIQRARLRVLVLDLANNIIYDKGTRISDFSGFVWQIALW